MNIAKLGIDVMFTLVSGNSLVHRESKGGGGERVREERESYGGEGERQRGRRKRDILKFYSAPVGTIAGYIIEIL